MLPLLRVLPVGSVLAAVLILVLAAPRVRPVLPHIPAQARGALIDASEHPEWRQFFLQAAYRRADEVDRLRDLPQTPTRMPPAEPAPTVRMSVPVAPLPAAESRTATVPAPPTAPKQEEIILPLPVPPIEVGLPSVESLSAPEADRPRQEQKLQMATATVPAQPPAAGATSANLLVAVPLPPAAPSIGIVPAPLPPDRPRQLAGLPAAPSAPDPDEVTGAITSPTTATLPIEIGETSSTELPIVLVPQRLPPPRPVRHPAQSTGKKKSVKTARTAKPRHTAAPTRKPAAAAQPATQPGVFESLFGNSSR